MTMLKMIKMMLKVMIRRTTRMLMVTITKVIGMMTMLKVMVRR